MENKELTHMMKNLCEQNLFMKHCGIKTRVLEDGSFEAYLDFSDFHKNPYGYLHGGILYTLADVGAGINARRFFEFPVTTNSDFHFFSNTDEGRVYARFSVLHRGKKTFVVRTTVSDDKDNLLAEGTFSFYNDLSLGK